MMSFSEKNEHTLTNTDTMSPFLIFFIVVTIGYVIYYAAIITIDMNAKPKEAVSTGETMEAPDGMDVSEENEENDESEEETTSREADDENDDDTSGFSEEETDDDGNHDINVNEVPPTIPPSEAESQSSDIEPSFEDDDDIYGIDKQTNDESVSEEETESTPSPEEEEPTSEQDEQLPSTQEESPEATPDTNEYTDTESEQSSNEESDTDKYTPDEEDLEAVKERMRQHLAKVALAEGAEIVDAEVHDDSEFEEKDSDIPLTLLDSDNYDTGQADEINESNESIITESMTPLRQDLFASTLFGALGRMKQEQKKTSDTPAINPDNIVKEENITKA